jgi:hypothetical protein
MILGAMVQKLWVFEVIGQGIGRAYAGANHQELTTCTNSGGQAKFIYLIKMDKLALSMRQPMVGVRPLVTGRLWADTWTGPYYRIFYIFLKAF